MEHVASDRLLSGSILTAYQQAIPILPQGNRAVPSQETQCSCSEASRWWSRWETACAARAGSTITYLPRAPTSPECEPRRCSWELSEGMKQQPPKGIWLHQHHLAAKLSLSNFKKGNSWWNVWHQHTLQKAFLCDSELNSLAKLYLQCSVPLHCTYAHIQLLIKAMAFV